MTAKRFEMGYDDGLLRFVKDNVTNTNLDIVDCWTVLNELNDENKQLKQFKNTVFVLINEMIETANFYRTPIKSLDYGDDLGYWNGVYQKLKELREILEKEKGVRRMTKRFTNHDDTILDTDGEQLISTDEIVDKMNELHEENNELRLQLNLCSDQRNEFHRGARENANRVGKLEKENEQLKKAYNDAKKDVEKKEQILKDIMNDNLLIQDIKKELEE